MSVRSRSGRTYKNILEKWKAEKAARKNWSINQSMKKANKIKK